MRHGRAKLPGVPGLRLALFPKDQALSIYALWIGMENGGRQKKASKTHMCCEAWEDCGPV